MHYISAVITPDSAADPSDGPPTEPADKRPVETATHQASDPTSVPGRWQGLFDLLATIDTDIEALYGDQGVHGVRPRFAFPLIRLAHTGPLTIRELAESLNRTHSAMSQTVAAMRHEGLVQSRPGTDARTRAIALTPRGQELVPLLEAEWRATETAVAELDDEVPHSLSAVARELALALERRPMRVRLQDHLQPPTVRAPVRGPDPSTPPS